MTWTSNENTTMSHIPYDGCDECDISIMRVAKAEYDAGTWCPIEEVFAEVDRRIAEEGA